MTERKWTPGPWEVAAGNGYDQILAADGSSLMANETYYPWVPYKMEDWHLIAAAPDLYEALELVDQYYGEDSDVFWKVREALAKARGEK